MTENYYEILGVADDAEPDEIRKTYRRLARKYHPDVSKEENAEERFKAISEAYLTLKDTEKRAEYDQMLKYGASGGQPPPGWEQGAPGGWQYQASGAEFDGDIFEELFGRRGRQGSNGGFAMRGDDVHYQIALTLEEAFQGTKQSISFPSSEVDAEGRVQHKTTNLTVTIPRGVVAGQKLRLRDKGNPGFGSGASGDLYLEISIAPHPLYTVDGKDLSLQLPVAPWEVALGESVSVPTLEGAVKLKIPAGAKAGQRMRLKGKGMPGNTPGDLYVVLQIVMPPTLSDEDRALFEQMKQQIDFDPRTGMRN